MALSSAGAALPVPDLYLSFDEGSPERFRDYYGRYDVTVTPVLSAVGASAYRGSGAASFSGVDGSRFSAFTQGIVSQSSVRLEPLSIRPRSGALFAPGNHIRDFSIEFWLCPASVENGEQILAWSSSYPEGRGIYIYQQIQCIISRNRLQWSFTNFFFVPL
jgi:hypothetical protein